jgi:hypothetical protein
MRIRDRFRQSRGDVDLVSVDAEIERRERRKDGRVLVVTDTRSGEDHVVQLGFDRNALGAVDNSVKPTAPTPKKSRLQLRAEAKKHRAGAKAEPARKTSAQTPSRMGSAGVEKPVDSRAWLSAKSRAETVSSILDREF